MSISLRDIVEEGSRGVVVRLSLPVREAVDHDDVDAACDDSIGGTVLELIPGIGSADLEAWKSILCLLDELHELGAGEGLAVQGLGADGDGVDCVLVLWGVLLEGVKVLGERLLVVGPVDNSQLVVFIQ